MIAGGQSNATTPLAQTELFSPTTNTLSAGASLVYPRVGPRANILPSGELILVGGACLTTTPPCIESFPPMEVYNDFASPAEFTSLDEYYPFEQHTTLVLPSGDLFAFGGFNNYQLDNVIHPDITDTSALLFTRVQPASDIFQYVSSQVGVDGASAQLLPSGRVAVVGGYLLNIFDPGLGYVDTWRPKITGVCISSTSCTVSTIASPIAPGSTITIGGTNLTGWNGSEAASGSASQSASNVPIVELQRIDSDYQQYLPFAGTAQYSSTTVTSTIPSTVNAGWYRLTVVASGIPSRPQYVEIGSTQLTTSSSLLAFGSVETGTTSSAQAFTLTNSGGIPITVGPLSAPTGFTLSGGTLTNPGATATSVNVLTTAQTLQSGGTLAINATFSPASAISYSGFLSGTNIPTNLVTLTGTGVASIPTLSPAAVSLPSTIVNQTSTAGDALTLTNSGTYTLTVTSYTASGDFTAQGPAAPFTIPAGGSASWDVVFSPKVTTPLTANNETGTFTVITDNGTKTASLTGTSLIPQGTVSPTSVSFASTAVGSAASAQTVTVTNNGTSALNIKEAAFGGANPGDFGMNTALPVVVAANGGTQTLSFSFTPHVSPATTENATVTFTSDDTVFLNAAASSNAIALSGTGLLATPSLTATSLNLGSVRENPTGGTTNKSTATVTLSNSGNTPLAVTAAPISGANSGDFSVSPTTASINGGGGNQVFTVTFTPHTAAAETATLSFTSTTSIPSVALFGTGVFPAVTVAPTSLTFASEPAGTASAPQTLVITNSGTAALDFSASGSTEPTLTGTNAADFTLSPASGALPQTLAAGASVSMSVTFNPSASPATENLARAASLNIPNNDGLTIAAVPLAGTAALSLNASALQLPDQALGTTSTSTVSTSGSTANTVTLVNLSNATLSIDTVNTKFNGTNAADFSLVTTVGGSSTSSIASGATADFTFVFKPTQSSSTSGKTLESASLSLVFLSGPTLTCAVSGNSIYALPAVSPTSLTLIGSTSTGLPTSGVRLGASTSTGGSFTVTNSGAVAMTLSSAAFSGANASDFSVAPVSGSFPITLGALGSGSNSASFTVTFAPKTTSAPGPESATLQFTSASGSPSVSSVAVAGTSLFPSVAVKPTSIAFGDQTAGTSSAQQTVVITNTGTDVLHFAAAASEPTLSGQAADFTLSPASGALPITLAAGASTSFAVAFAPPAGASGSPGATISIANTDGLTISTIALSGSVPALGSSALAIPDTALGSSSSSTAVVGTNTVQLTNPGSSALAITAATISGANAGDFALLAGSPTSIAAGATGSFTVVFTPSLSGSTTGSTAETAALDLVTAAGGYSCALSSHSLYAVARLTAPAVFPATPDGTTSSTSGTATLSNTGQEPLSVTGYSLSGRPVDFAVTSVIPSSGSPLSVAAGSQANITFSFSPRAARAESASFSLVSNSGAAAPPPWP